MKAVLVVLVVLSCFTVQSYGQITGSISGRVVDTANHPIYGAYVIIGRSYGARTKSDGSFRITGIAVGDYVMKVAFVGMKLLEANVTVNPGKITETATSVLREKPLQEIRIWHGDTKQTVLEDSSNKKRKAKVIVGKISGIRSCCGFSIRTSIAKDILRYDSSLDQSNRQDLGTITGRVVDVDNKPIGGAKVRIGDRYSVRTKPDGRFTVPRVIPEEYEVGVKSVGCNLFDKMIRIQTSQNYNLGDIVLEENTVGVIRCSFLIRDEEQPVSSETSTTTEELNTENPRKPELPVQPIGADLK